MSSEIGRVVAVSGFAVTIELDSGHRSPVRASIDGAETHVRINAFLTFDLGAGDLVLGTITNLYAREIYEPDSEDLTLELARPRRTAVVQLLGSIRTRSRGEVVFDPGINVLPTLDTAAVSATPQVLDAVLKSFPKTEQQDGSLRLGQAVAATDKSINGSFNDLLSRPLAVVGNTGSGKSCSIAHVVQEAIRAHQPTTRRPKFFVFDINGEYGKAFGIADHARQPNQIYINAHQGTIPVWLMNAGEACQWLSASEQTQQPALVNLWAIAKTSENPERKRIVDSRHALAILRTMQSIIRDESERKKGSALFLSWGAFKGFAPWARSERLAACEAIDRVFDGFDPDGWSLGRSLGAEERGVCNALEALVEAAQAKLVEAPATIEQTADMPVHFDVARLDDPAYLEQAAELSPGDRSIRQFLQGLRLRIQNRRSDKRWHCFYNYDEVGVSTAVQWFQGLGIGLDGHGQDVCVIDCSMLSHEVLPFACGIVGRMLLELRECSLAATRYVDPWVIVLEEAHNYVRPRRQDEARGLAVSREAFERIAKEGRKFGLSLVVASQRPSDVSPTVLSQCANFITHRLQNPDDIEHFRRIVPAQSRRLLDQITILGAGEAIVVGSAFHIPSRVQVDRPSPEPASKSSRPFSDWAEGSTAFDVHGAMRTWLQSANDVSNHGKKKRAPREGRTSRRRRQ